MVRSDSDSDSDTENLCCNTSHNTTISSNSTELPTRAVQLPQNSISENKIIFQCPLCKETCSRKQHLRRHIERKHKDNLDILETLKNGKTSCLDYGKRFRRTVDLIPHLTEVHEKQFQMENLTFQNKEGNRVKFRQAFMVLTFGITYFFLNYFF